jgi:hypothetical protein
MSAPPDPARTFAPLQAESTVDLALRRAGFRRGRTKLTVTSPDPDYEVKRQRIEALGTALGRGSAAARA